MRTSPLLDRYKGIVGESQIEQIYEVARSLAGLRVLHVNTTAQGGGVAEILHELLPLMEELDLKHDWKVIPIDEASGYFTARLVDMLQGYDRGEFPEREKQVFLEKLRRSVRYGQVAQADLYFIQLKRADGATAGTLAYQMGWMKPQSVTATTNRFGITAAAASVVQAYQSDPTRLIGSFTSTFPS